MSKLDPPETPRTYKIEKCHLRVVAGCLPRCEGDLVSVEEFRRIVVQQGIRLKNIERVLLRAPVFLSHLSPKPVNVFILDLEEDQPDLKGSVSSEGLDVVQKVCKLLDLEIDDGSSNIEFTQCYEICLDAETVVTDLIDDEGYQEIRDTTDST